MSTKIVSQLQDLLKSLEGGSQGGAASAFNGGAVLGVENLDKVMVNVCFQDEDIKLQKKIKVVPTKSPVAQFNTLTSYGRFGGSAVLEGAVGRRKDIKVNRKIIPMSFYAEMRTTTDFANVIETFDGEKASDREAEAAAKTIAGSIEFDCFRGHADYSNNGVFDGNPATMWLGPNLHGLDVQLRQSDIVRGSRDQMFSEYGSDASIVINGGGTLTQENIVDAKTRSRVSFGNPKILIVDPFVLANYGKLALNLQRIVLGGSPQTSSGADLKHQWTSFGGVDIEDSNFLLGKVQPEAEIVETAPALPTLSIASTTDSSAVTSFALNAVYQYYVTGNNQDGEGAKSATTSRTISAAGDKVVITITPGSGVNRFFNVYRGLAGGKVGTEKFIGRVKASAGTTTTFVDLNNKIPGFVTGFMVDFTDSRIEFMEAMSYSRKKLAITDLSETEAHYRWLALAVKAPRRSILIENLR